MRRYAKIDANQRAIVEYLRAHGCTVVSLATVGGGVPDLLVGRNRVTLLMEVKREGVVDKKRGAAQASTNALQADFRAKWRGGPCVVVTSPEGALSALTASIMQVSP